MQHLKRIICSKGAVGSLLALAVAANLASCSTNDEDLVIEENGLNAESSQEQFTQPSDFVPDAGAVYTITSSSAPLTLSTNGSGRVLDTPKDEITVQELWTISPSTTPGTYYIDGLGGESRPRLVVSGFASPLFTSTSSTGLSTSWSITSAGGDDFFITNVANTSSNRLTSFRYGFGTFVFGARLTSDSNASDLEKFQITEFESGDSANRAPVTRADALSLNPFQTATLNVLSNDFDPDGDALSLVGFNNTDSRISVVQVGNALRIRLMAFSQTTIVRFTYTVSDGNGATSQETVTVGRRRNNF